MKLGMEISVNGSSKDDYPKNQVVKSITSHTFILNWMIWLRINSYSFCYKNHGMERN